MIDKDDFMSMADMSDDAVDYADLLLSRLEETKKSDE